MIRRLRLKFVCINMTIVTIMLCVIFGLVLHFTGRSLEQESYDMMRSVAMDPLRLGVPGEDTAGVRLPYFALQLGPGGELAASGGGYFDLTDRELLDKLVALSSTEKSGVLKEYGLRFVRVVTPTAQCIVFADMSSELNTIHNLLRTCILIGLASFCIFLLISILLARWAVRPVEAAWEGQRQFTADASHELKTPLTVILSSAQLLTGAGEDQALRDKLTESILSASRQMKDLVTQLLDSARADRGMEAMEVTSFALGEAVSEAVLSFDCLFYEEGLELTAEVPEGLQIRGDRSRLVQVVRILLDNARKYSDPGGKTRVALQARGRRECLLTVSNQGPPLSPAELKNIFKRFYRADAARERTGSYGLGLSIAESIVTAHRGRIWAESKNGVNTFFVLLPVPAGRER